MIYLLFLIPFETPFLDCVIEVSLTASYKAIACRELICPRVVDVIVVQGEVAFVDDDKIVTVLDQSNSSKVCKYHFYPFVS